jgi:hypothetical protein
MSHDFIGDLMNALKRVLAPDVARLKEVLIFSGMPEETQNLRYLGFNRQVVTEAGRTLEFSAVAVINNRRVEKWRLEGTARKLNRMVFNPRWTRNPLDLFLSRLRCNPQMMDLLASAAGDYTLVGILAVVETAGKGLLKRHYRSVRPVIAVSGIDAVGVERVAAFEDRNEICKVKVRGLPLYRRVARKPPAR